MGGRVRLGGLFFDSAGRIGRVSFMAAAAVLVAIFGAYEALVRGPVHLASAWLVHLVLVFSGASVLAKRLHDCGRSGWWAAPILLAFVIAWPTPRSFAGWAAMVVLAVASLALALRPGDAGPNRYGTAKR